MAGPRIQDLGPTERPEGDPRASGWAPAERRALRRAALRDALGAAALAALAAAVPLLVAASTRARGVGSRGEFLPLLPLVCWWAWLLRGRAGRLRHTLRDLAEPAVAWHEGPAWVESRRGVGLIAVVHHRLRLGDREFAVAGRLARTIVPGTVLRVRAAHRSGVLLDVQPAPAAAARGTAGLPGPPSDPPTGSAAAQPLLPTTGPPLPLASASPAPAPVPALTDREAAVLRLIAAGRSTKEIAAALSLSPNTIKMYTGQLFRKLGARRRTDAVERARSAGLL